MAEKEEEIYITSGRQLYESRQSRKVIPLTLSADISLGAGLPLGCTLLFGGKPKSGKTTSSLQWAANSQRLYGTKVFFANVEGRLDNKVLSQINNLDLDNFEVIMGPPIYDKKNKNEILGHKKLSSQQWWKKIGELILENPKSFIIVDSISSLCEESEMSTGMGFQSRGGLQKLESQFSRQFGDLIVASQITLVLLAQVQANTSGYGEALLIKAGNAIRHMADGIIFIKNVEKWKPDASGRILGQDMVWKVEASPLGSPYIETRVPLRFGQGVDRHMDIVRNAVDWRVIQGQGAWYCLPFKEIDGKLVYQELSEDKEENKDFIKAQGEENLRSWLVKNSEQNDIIEKIIREKVLI
jgi:RecA/RadA recombinase